MNEQGKCEHEEGEARVKFVRFSTVDDGPVTHYAAEVELSCKQCGMPFEFVGLPVGSSPYAPTTNLEGTTLEAPIVVPGTKPPLGLPSLFTRVRTD